MPAARYWRIVGISTYGGGDLELSEIALYDGATRVDGSATLTSTVAPIAGSLANIKDADTGTTVRFAAADLRQAGFALVWDFGASQEVNDLNFGAIDRLRFIDRYEFDYLDETGKWVSLLMTFGLNYNGDGVLQNNLIDDSLFEYTHSTYNFIGTYGSLQSYDKYRTHSIGTTATSGLTTSHGGSLALGVSGANMPIPELGGDFCLEFQYLHGGVTTTTFMVFPNGYKFYARWTNLAAQMAISIRNAANTALSSEALLYLVEGFSVLAWTRQSGVNRFFANGVQVGATFTDTTVHAAGNAFLGTSGNSNSGFYRAIRLTVGHHRYAANYTAGVPYPFRNLGPTSGVTTTPTSISEYPVPEPTLRSAETAAFDQWYWGKASLVGNVREFIPPNSTQPLMRRVRLFSALSMVFLKETWSDPVTGNFAFHGIQGGQEFVVVAYDHLGIYRPAAVNKFVEAVA